MIRRVKVIIEAIFIKIVAKQIWSDHSEGDLFLAGSHVTVSGIVEDDVQIVEAADKFYW
jgi:hypothetical protein